LRLTKEEHHMTTTISNTRAAQPITIDEIQANIDKAQHCFVSSKDSAAEAGAHTYIVWLETMSPLANADAKDWIKKQIEDRNIAIDVHNAAEKSERKRVRDYLAGKLKEDDGESARLTNLAKLTDDEWAARRKVCVEARANANDFTTIVKFVLNFERPADASVISRFATVLEWIHARFDGVEIQDTSEIVTAIKDAGGFEMVLIEQRNKGESGGSKGAEEREIEAEERKIIEEAIAAKAKAAVQTAPAIATIDMQISDANQDIVVLIGRYVGGKIEVVDNIPLEAGEVDSMVSRISDDLLPPADESTEFIARVLALGDIVAEGKATEKTRDGTVMGEKLVEQRTLSLLPDGEENTQLVISALHADSSAVIKATPEPSRVSLGKVRVPMMMLWESSRILQTKLRDRDNRRLIDIVATDDTMSTDGRSARSAIS
jgi:hypothetical protein